MKNLYRNLAITAAICILALTQSHHLPRIWELIVSVGVPVVSCLIWLGVIYKSNHK